MDSPVSRPDVHLYRENEEIAKEEVEKGRAVTEAEARSNDGDANTGDKGKSIGHRDDSEPAREKEISDSSPHLKDNEAEGNDQSSNKESVI